LVLAGCSSDKGFGETNTVSSEQLGTAWPLTVDSAKLNCKDGWVSVFVDHEGFRIDDVAGPDDVSKKFLRYWATDASRDSGRRDLAALVSMGEALCD